jgi:hypothetical protein
MAPTSTLSRASAGAAPGSTSGVIMVVGQKIALGRAHAHTTVTVYVADTTLTIETDDGDTRTVAVTTTQPVRNIRPMRPRKAAP